MAEPVAVAVAAVADVARIASMELTAALTGNGMGTGGTVAADELMRSSGRLTPCRTPVAREVDGVFVIGRDPTAPRPTLDNVDPDMDADGEEAEEDDDIDASLDGVTGVGNSAAGTGTGTCACGTCAGG